MKELKTMIHKRYVGLVVAACFLAGGIGYWMHISHASKGAAGTAAGGDAEGQSRAVQAAIFEIHQDRLHDAIEGLIGTIKGNTIELTFNGQEERLEGVHVRVGERVKKGNMLFELDHTRSEARRNQAQANFDRAKDLQSVGGATLRDVDEAASALKLAQKDYDDSFIYSPQDGYVSQINHQAGETIGRNEVVAVLISSHDKFYLETGVIEGQLEQVAQGQKATVEIEALGNQPIDGYVLGVSHEVTTTGRIGTVHVALPNSVQPKLRPGQSARCKIYVFNQKTLPIPRSAYDHDKKGVYVVGEDNRAHLINIKLGHLTRDYYAVLDGLKEGDRIINDLASTPVAENDEVSASGDPVKYKNPEGEAEKS